jgi:hypothetical protein
MTKYEVLSQLENKEISVNDAYHKIYKSKNSYRKAHFIKFKFKIKESRLITIFLKILFFLPMPIVLLKIIARIAMRRKGLQDINISEEDILKLISTKGILIDIDAKNEVKVKIKTI